MSVFPHYFTADGRLNFLPLYSDAQSSVFPLLHHIIPSTNTLFLSFFQLLMVHTPTDEESHHTEPEQKQQDQLAKTVSSL